MRHKSLLSALAVLTLSWGVSACETDLTAINENPNEPTDVGAAQIAPEAMNQVVGRVFGRGNNMDVTGAWAQHYAQIQYPTEDMFEVQSFANAWDDLYLNGLEEFETMIRKSEETGATGYEAIGRTMSAWTYHVLTDFYGNIPYTESNRGDDEEAINQPAYDAQSDVYAGILSELETAATLAGSAENVGVQDLIHGGDMAQWQKFANSLRMRVAMRMADADGAAAEAAFTAAYNTGSYIADNADNATLVYPGTPPNENPWFEDKHRGNRDDHAVSETLVDVLEATADVDDIVVCDENCDTASPTNRTIMTIAQRPVEGLDDPRLAIFAEPAELDGAYKGAMNNLNKDNKGIFSQYSRIGSLWRDEPGTPAVLMSAAEVQFLIAEAAQRGWVTDVTAQEAYEAGITLSMEQYGIDDAAIADYLDNPGVAWGDADPYRQIAVQKWIALYGNGTEAWTEYRRTGYPELVLGTDAALSEIPSRFRYPALEEQLNNENWSAAVNAQGENTMTTKLWWDVN